LHIKNLIIVARDFIVINLQGKAIIEDIIKEDINKDINIKEVVIYLKKKRTYIS